MLETKQENNYALIIFKKKPMNFKKILSLLLLASFSNSFTADKIYELREDSTNFPKGTQFTIIALNELTQVQKDELTRTQSGSITSQYYIQRFPAEDYPGQIHLIESKYLTLVRKQ